jgi:parvulin-like peptidyl-prolyl isomerase
MLLIAFISVSVGCAKKPAAVVNGDEISEGVVQWNLDQRMTQHRASGAVVAESLLRNKVIDKLISEKLMYQGAAEKGLAVDDHELNVELHRITESMGQDAFDRSLREASLSKEAFSTMVKEKLMADKFAASIIKADDVSDEDVREYFQDSPTPFLMPEQVNVRFIQTRTKEQAEEIIDEIKKGKSFDKLADDLMKLEEATVSAYSWAKPSFFSPDIAEALTEIKVGKHGGPFKSGDGYFIFRVKERQHERAKTLEEASGEIKSMLVEQRRQSALVHWLAERRKQADIMIN